MTKDIDTSKKSGSGEVGYEGAENGVPNMGVRSGRSGFSFQT
jgi:hypothetical protein